MDIAAQPGYSGDTRKSDRTSAKVVAGGSLAEGIAGAGALTLAILGLIGFYPLTFLAIATICAGAALLFESGAISTRISYIMREATGEKYSTSELGGGITTEFLAGLAGVTLGILALFDYEPIMLVSISIIAFGAALALGAASTAQINSLNFNRYIQNQDARSVASNAVNSDASVQVLIGFGAIVLGVLALVGIQSTLLNLIGVLSVGFSNFLSGSSIGGKMLRLFRR